MAMPIATPHLDRLTRRWRDRVLLVRAAEAFVLLALLAWLVGAAMAPLAAAGWLSAARSIALAALAPLAAATWLRVTGRPMRRLLARPVVLSLAGWAFGCAVLPVMMHWTNQAAGASAAGWGIHAARVCLALVVAAVAAAVVASRSLRRRVLPWLDARTGSHMLLHTASELASADRPIGEVEAAVIARAERLAGQPGAFAGVSAWRVPARVWALLPIAMALAGLTTWVSFELRPPADGPTAPGGPGAAAQAAAVQLAGLVPAGSGDDSPAGAAVRDAADRVRSAGSPEDAKAALDAAGRSLEADIAAARPILAAIGVLAGRPAGAPLEAVLRDPGQPGDAIAAAVARQVEQMQKAALSPADRQSLANDLRQAAERVRWSDPALADRLTRAADALVAGRWEDVLSEMNAIARQIQPMAIGRKVAESALRVIHDALSDGAGGDAANVARVEAVGATASRPPADPRWAVSREQAREDLSRLPTEKQETVRRYFGLD